VREAAAVTLPKVIGVVTQQITEEFMLPYLIELGGNPNNLYRITFLFCATSICKSNLKFIPNFIQIVEKLSKDGVPNVRLNVAKFCSILLELGENRNNSQLIQILKYISNDEDNDVKFLAQSGLDKLRL
jgi:hypothetical protein